MIRALHPFEFTQGTIFSCALAEAYSGVPVFGLIITARCDAAQGKAEIFNYVPLVPLEAWMVREGTDIVAKRVAASARGSMRSALSEVGMSTSILENVELGEITKELSRGTSKQEKAAAARFDKSVVILSAAEAIVSASERTETEALGYLESNEALSKSLIKELLTNGLADFHFLDKSQPGETCHGYVALLREIRFVSAKLAKAISKGVDYNEYKTIVGARKMRSDELNIEGPDDFSMPLAAVESPFIEFIMQRFTQLFSRIGVTDIPVERVRGVQEVIVSMRKGLS